jgi:hypothetical protein
MKRTAYVIVFLFFLASSIGAHAALEKDLGQALAYLRVTEANADTALVVDTIEHRPALVLDLRSLSSDTALASAIQTALAKPPAPHAIRVVLINSTTAPTFVTAITDSLASVITIGPRSPAITPDIAVSISDDDDRRAFAALANGTPLEKLINDSHQKARYDEARLVQDHANGVSPADSALPADAEDESVTNEPASEDKKPLDAAKKTAPPPMIDLVLERAVQLHRSLLALKKL